MLIIKEYSNAFIEFIQLKAWDKLAYFCLSIYICPLRYCRSNSSVLTVSLIKRRSSWSLLLILSAQHRPCCPNSYLPSSSLHGEEWPTLKSLSIPQVAHTVVSEASSTRSSSLYVVSGSLGWRSCLHVSSIVRVCPFFHRSTFEGAVYSRGKTVVCWFSSRFVVGAVDSSGLRWLVRNIFFKNDIDSASCGNQLTTLLHLLIMCGFKYVGQSIPWY